jgi:hypothetical protein
LHTQPSIERWHDRSWSNGPVSFDGSRKAALARLLQENLMSGAPCVGDQLKDIRRQGLLPQIMASDDEDESWWFE